MDTQPTFFALAGTMLALVLAGILPYVWRDVGRQPAVAQARQRAWRMTLLLVCGLPAVAFGFYGLYGDLGALSAERKLLSAQLLQHGMPADGEASERIAVELERYLRKRPRDQRALVLKARLDMDARRFEEAVAAFQGALAGNSKVANDPGVWAEYAEARGMAQGGSLLGEPLQLVQQALRLDAGHARALDLAGSAAWEMRDYAKAATYWKRLLAQMQPGDARHAELAGAIERAERRARLALPAAP